MGVTAREPSTAGSDTSHADVVALTAASQGDPALLSALVARRAAGEPLAHLVGAVTIAGVHLLSGPGGFVPQPETADVIAGAVVAMQAMTSPLVVDLCTGVGTMALALAAARSDASVHAVELSPDAYRWLIANVEHTGLPVKAHCADARVALPELDGLVDVVVSNPPYVAEHELAGVAAEVRDHDPRVALVAGADGLDVIRLVVARAAGLLRPGGLLVVEHSDRQGRSAPDVLRQAGFRHIRAHQDRLLRDRWVSGLAPAEH